MAVAPLSRLIEIADMLFPFSEAEPWDNCGLQVGRLNQDIHSVCFALDAVKDTVHWAADRSCQALFTHHPLMMTPLKSISPDTMVGEAVFEAIRLGVSVVSLHTNLDAAPGGLNDYLTDLLELTDVSVPQDASCARSAKTKEPIRISDLASRIATQLGISEVRRISDTDRLVQNVFVVSGSGMGFLPQALHTGADVIITGDVKYHAAREALSSGLSVIDAGHFGLERPAIKLMSSVFGAEFTNVGLEIQCLECDVERDPFSA